MENFVCCCVFNKINLQRDSNSGSSSTAVTTPEVGNDAQPVTPPHIHSKRKNWYSSLCNRWLSLFGVCNFFQICFLRYNLCWVYQNSLELKFYII